MTTLKDKAWAYSDASGAPLQWSVAKDYRSQLFKLQSVCGLFLDRAGTMSGHEAGPRMAEPEFKELRANRSHFASALNARIADPPALAKELEDVSAEQGHGLTHMVHFIGCVNDPDF